MAGCTKGMAGMTFVAAQIQRHKQQPRRLAWLTALLPAALLLAPSPAAAQAQVSTSNGELLINTPGGQQLSTTQNQNHQSATPQGPVTGTFCIEEMTATFCNVPSGPNTNGYGSVGGVSTAASGSTASTGTGITTSSTPPCMREPPVDELCN
jgi:hypothetical protein